MLDATQFFEAPLRELLSPVGSETADYRALAKKYLTEMQEVTIEWDSPEGRAEVEWKRLKLISEVRFVKKGGETWVQWALPPTLVKALADPRSWTGHDLMLLGKFSTYTTVALYDFCSRYRNNPSGVTSRNSTDWLIDRLSGSPPPLDELGKPKRREWRKVKNEFVTPAIEQINAESDIEIDLIEHKEGRAVAEVQFSVRKKLLQVDAKVPLPANGQIMVLAERLGVSGKDLEGLLRERTEEEVMSALEKLGQRKAMQGLEEVRSPSGYLRHLLTKQGPDDRTQPAVSSTPTQEEPPSSWLSNRIDTLADEVARLQAEVRTKLLQKVSESMRGRGMLTPSTSRRLSQGDWSVGLIRYEVVRAYALEVIGPAWDKEPLVIEADPSPTEVSELT